MPTTFGEFHRLTARSSHHPSEPDGSPFGQGPGPRRTESATPGDPRPGTTYLSIDIPYLSARRDSSPCRYSGIPATQKETTSPASHAALSSSRSRPDCRENTSCNSSISGVVGVVSRSGFSSNAWARARVSSAPRSPLLLAVVETADELAATESIAGTDGVDGIFVGPHDLSLSLGLGTPDQPEVLHNIREVVSVTRSHGKVIGVYAGRPELLALTPELDLVAVDIDVTALRIGRQQLFSPANPV